LKQHQNEIYRNPDFKEACRIILPDFQQITVELIEYFATHPDDLYRLEWRKFEELLEAVFRNQGFYTELGPGWGDQGVDLRLIQKDSVGEILTLVQAKRYSPNNPIGLEAVAALYAIVEDQKANRGLFVTTSRYLPVAKKFAEKQNHRLLLATSREVAEWCKSVSNRKRT
jgi:restriction endonuclease Mrr